jgi:hypothetical protein
MLMRGYMRNDAAAAECPARSSQNACNGGFKNSTLHTPRACLPNMRYNPLSHSLVKSDSSPSCFLASNQALSQSGTHPFNTKHSALQFTPLTGEE